MGIVENMICFLFKGMLNVELFEFFCMVYVEVMFCFGSDKLDLRILLELIDVDDLMCQVEFKVFFVSVLDLKGRVCGLRIFGGVLISCKEIDEYIKYVSIYGVCGLVWIKVNDFVVGVDGL